MENNVKSKGFTKWLTVLTGVLCFFAAVFRVIDCFEQNEIRLAVGEEPVYTNIFVAIIWVALGVYNFISAWQIYKYEQ